MLNDKDYSLPRAAQQSGLIAPTAPKPLTHEDRINQLESRLQQLSNELAAIADSHAGQLTALQQKVGG